MKITVNRVRCLDAVRHISALMPGTRSVGKVDAANGQPRLKGQEWYLDKMIRLRATSAGLECFGGSKEGFAQVVVAPVDGEAVDGGEVMVYPGRLVQMLSLGSGDTVKLAMNTQDELCVIMQWASYELDYPRDGGSVLQIAADLQPLASCMLPVLKTAINRTLFATGEDDFVGQFGYELICVEVTTELTLCSGSRSHASIAKLQSAERLDAKQTELKLAVPVKAMDRLLSFMGDESEKVSIVTAPGLIGFKFKSGGMQVEYYSSLLEKRMPRYHAILPSVDGRLKYTVRADALGMAA